MNLDELNESSLKHLPRALPVADPQKMPRNFYQSFRPCDHRIGPDAAVEYLESKPKLGYGLAVMGTIFLMILSFSAGVLFTTKTQTQIQTQAQTQTQKGNLNNGNYRIDVR